MPTRESARKRRSDPDAGDPRPHSRAPTRRSATNNGERKPARVLAYARVSSVEQGKGTSLDGQRDEIARRCRERGYPAPLFFVEMESGSGAAAERRAEQLRLMAQVRPGDLVLVTKQDRWSRDTIHFLSSADTIDRLGAKLTSLAEGLDVSSPEQRLAATTFASFSEFERRRIAERTITGRSRLRAAGCHVDGTPPYGYRRDGHHLVVVPERAKRIVEMFKACVAGRTAREIAEAMKSDHAAVCRRIKDRRYLGLSPVTPFRGRESRGRTLEVEWVEGTHEALIDLTTWEAAQVALSSRRTMVRRPGEASRNREFLVRSYIRCGSCGRLLHGHNPGPDASVAHSGWYICRQRRNCGGVSSARQDQVDADVTRLVLARLEQLADELAKPSRAEVKVVPKFDDERVILRRKKERLVDAIAEGMIAASDAKMKLAEIAEKLAEIDAREAAWKAERKSLQPEVRAEHLRDLKQLRLAWEGMTVAERREVVMLHAVKLEIVSTKLRRWERGAWEIRVTWKQ